MTSMLPCLSTDLQGMCSWAEAVLHPLVGCSQIHADLNRWSVCIKGLLVWMRMKLRSSRLISFAFSEWLSLKLEVCSVAKWVVTLSLVGTNLSSLSLSINKYQCIEHKISSHAVYDTSAFFHLSNIFLLHRLQTCTHVLSSSPHLLWYVFSLKYDHTSLTVSENDLNAVSF